MLLTIDKMDDEGRGRAVFNGREYAVRGAFPGDEVEIKEERLFKAHNLCLGRVKRYWKKGPHHIPRSCHHRLPCPACPLHDASETLAHEVKRQRIVNALQEAGLDFEVEAMIPHPNILGYRQKVKLMVKGDPGNLKLGVYVPYSHTFQEASQCPHVNPAINEAILKLMPVLNQACVDGLRAVILRASEDGVAGILVTTRPLPEAVFTQSPLLSLRERIQSTDTNSILSGTLGQSVGPEKMRSLEDEQLVDPEAFCQPDPVQARRLYDMVADFLWQGSGIYIDAYAGVGGFAKALLRKGTCEIIAIESNPMCFEALRQLGVQAHISLSNWWRGIKGEVSGEGEILGLVLDPPKKGLLQEAQAYAQLGAKRIALVSCEPSSMVRDLKVLLAHGYQIERIQPIDLFGGTPAIETVVFLRQ